MHGIKRRAYAVAKMYAYWITVNYRESYDMFACNGKGAELFLCAPEGLKDAARQSWRDQGAKGRIHDEAFDFRAAL